MNRKVQFLIVLLILGLSHLTNACNPFTPTISGATTFCTPSTGTNISAGTYSSYLWNTGETTDTIFAGAGNYAVTVTDNNGCTGTNTVTIIGIDYLPMINVISDGGGSVGDTLVLYASGIPPFSIVEWWGDAMSYVYGDTVSEIIETGGDPVQFTVVAEDSTHICYNTAYLTLVFNEINPRFTMVADTNQLHHYFLVCNFVTSHPPLTNYDWNWGDGSQDD